MDTMAVEPDMSVASCVSLLYMLPGSNILVRSGWWLVNPQEEPSDEPITLSRLISSITMAENDKPDLKILPFDEVPRQATQVNSARLISSVPQARLSEDDKDIILFQWLASTQRSLEDATPVSPRSGSYRSNHCPPLLGYPQGLSFRTSGATRENHRGPGPLSSPQQTISETCSTMSSSSV